MMDMDIYISHSGQSQYKLVFASAILANVLDEVRCCIVKGEATCLHVRFACVVMFLQRYVDSFCEALCEPDEPGQY